MVPPVHTDLWKLSQGWTSLWGGIVLRGWCFTLSFDSNLLRVPDITREIKRKDQKGKTRKTGEKQI